MSAKIDFPSIDWERVTANGMDGRVKKWMGNGRRIRVLELSPKWNEQVWCETGHSAYVLDGTLFLNFETGHETLEIRKGEGFSVPLGTKHKASCKKKTLVFFVDDLPPSK